MFLQHCDHSTTVELVKHHLRMNSIDTTGIRVDVASKEIAEFRSFRMLAPNDLRETLLQPDLWPDGVRVKDYVIYTKPHKAVSKPKYRNSSGVARGGRGGAAAPGRRPEGGAKILPMNF